MKDKPKRLFFDIEVSFNVVATWNIGYNLSISHENILKERAIICICYKWEDDSKVCYLKWNNGDDKQILKKFIGILNSADEIVGHNSDRFDLKWLRTRCIYHNIPMFPDYHSIDTLKLSRSGFKFNSNRLDYIGGYLGVGRKLKNEGFELWKNIVLSNSSKSMLKMIKYCSQDVKLLEKVFKKLNSYTRHKHHLGVLYDHDKCSCPNCTSDKTISNRRRITATGIKKIQMNCRDCGKYFSISEQTFIKERGKK